MAEHAHRKRSKLACRTCRDLKRKCNGARPCETCVRFEYDCNYDNKPSRRSRLQGPSADPVPAPQEPLAVPKIQANIEPSHATSRDHLRSLEANSAAAFLRRLALGMDPSDAPRMHLFAWNAFMGAREMGMTPRPRPITEIISETQMRSLSAIYFEKIHPCYGFLDHRELENHVRIRWQMVGGEHPYDAVLCGVAALGSLFSNVHPWPEEVDLITSARITLETAANNDPTLAVIMAWLLRVSYLRMTGTPHAAWMASSTLMHLVEAAGIHSESPTDSVLQSFKEEVDLDVRRRIFGIAEHLNIWISFDIGRSRVQLHNTTTMSPIPRPGSHTSELLQLLPYSEMLDPEKTPDIADLDSALSKVLENGSPQHPTYVAAQCNLMLCICRRLRAHNISLHGPLLNQILSTTLRALRAAQAMADMGAPWHHMVNMPFQIVCILLVIDTVSSISQLKEAMQRISSITAKYNTEATQEALRTASLLILLHQRRKDRCMSMLDDVLRTYPVSNPGDGQDGSGLKPTDDFRWLDDLTADIEGFGDFNLDQVINQGFYTNGGNDML